MANMQRLAMRAAAVMRREGLLHGLEKRFMTLRLQAEVMIYADLGPIREKSPSN
jgi:hypothetical protein